MTDIKIKICGITNLEDALASAVAGADAIGFVFFEGSQRYCPPENAKLISKKTPPFLTKVGLFVNHDKNFIRDILDQNIIDVIQFHGNECNDFCKSFNFPFIKVIPVRKSTDIVKISEEFIDASSILLDTFDTKHYGGSGKSFDWSLIPKDTAKPIIIAGGLNVENVKTLIRHYKPYAVDVSGGVEDGVKGVKCHKLLNSFIKVVKNAKL
ncbi:MAG: phosphoribosylanthranilate isomerase [Proteobacteria bacterium]|jgi:phosphoribosylanthranilate isomerase|nr:phosphoribosylanthranilate isomerase [Pseudomonadota bacterium]MDA0941837.1 phosphoribosylanthranilate isomerase [Pseudomonadota bacterium]MDA1034990.1 phosphoribosylanthranilate isomerase [Pseudomonadota bacterium]